MGHIKERSLKDGKVRFQAEIRLKGHPTLSASFDRKTDAKNWIQKTEADIRAGRNQLHLAGKKYTFNEALERYYNQQSISTAKKGHLDWWNNEFGHLYLKDIRPALISEKKHLLLTTNNTKGQLRTKSTCNRYLASLSHFFSVCEKQWELIQKNPVRKISREKEPRGRTRFLNEEERTKLIDACKDSESSLLLLFVVLLLSTGCRYNEIRQLKWTDVNLFKGCITLNKTKNGDIRSVPLRGYGLDLLSKRARLVNSIGYVFAEDNQKKPIDPRRALKTAIKRAGLKDFRPHDLRHSYATELLANGLSLGEIGPLLGHRDVATTRRYAHLVESRVINIVFKMSEKMFKSK
jgi:integrase